MDNRRRGKRGPRQKKKARDDACSRASKGSWHPENAIKQWVRTVTDPDEERADRTIARRLGISVRQFRALRLMLPFMAWGLFALVLFLVLERDTFLTVIGFMLAYMVPPAGKETIIPIAILNNDINWVLISLAISWQDIVTSMLIVYNFDIMKKVPLLGPWIDRFEEKNVKVLVKKPWMRRFAYLGLVLFVIVPFQGSGGVGASVLGRAIGMRPSIVLSAIVVGSLVGTLMVAYIALTVGTALLGSFKTTEARIMLAAVLIGSFAAYFISMRSYKKKEGLV